MTPQLSIYVKYAVFAGVNDGLSLQSLATATGTSRTSLYKWIKLFESMPKEKLLQREKRFSRSTLASKSTSRQLLARVKREAIIYPEKSLDELARTFALSRSTIWKILSQQKLSTKQARKTMKTTYYRHLERTIDIKLYAAIRKAERSGMSISELCRKFAISRTTYYALQKTSHFQTKKLPVKGERHYRFIVNGQEQVLAIVATHPDFSLRRIAAELQRVVGAGSTFYVYSLLKEYDLTTMQQRQVYMAGQFDAITEAPRMLTGELLQQFIRGLVFPVAFAGAVVVILLPLGVFTSPSVLPTKTGKVLGELAQPYPRIINEQIDLQDSTQGVLAVNLNKSVFVSGEQVRMAFSVLDAQGMGSCYASMSATLTTPSGKKQLFATDKRTITLSPSCGAATITDKPDYWTDYTAKEEGNYTVALTSVSKAGIQHATTSFTVAKNLPFTIERSSASRVWPWVAYTMRIKVHAQKDFTGKVIEQIPDDFIVQTATGVVNDTGGYKLISWPTRLKAGEEAEFTYQYDAPDISPALYRLGQLQIQGVDAKQSIFVEPHAWQLAIDGL